MRLVMNIDFFTNDKYKILDCMQKRQIDIFGNRFVPLSQREISDITGIAYKTVNSSVKALKDHGYILHNGKTRGKYILTKKTESFFSEMQNKGTRK